MNRRDFIRTGSAALAVGVAGTAAAKTPDEVIAAVTDIFQEAGYRVGVNRPYANAIAPLGYRGHSLMIEINKRCYMDEAKLCKHDGFARCHECLEQVYSTLLK